MSLRFLGGESRMLPNLCQAKDHEGYYKAHEAEEVHRGGDDRDAVGVRVEPDSVADDRAIVGRKRRGGRRDEPRERAYAEHREKTRAQLTLAEAQRREEGGGQGTQGPRQPVGCPADKKVHAGREGIDQGEVPEGVDGRKSTRGQKAEVYLRGESA